MNKTVFANFALETLRQYDKTLLPLMKESSAIEPHERLVADSSEKSKIETRLKAQASRHPNDIVVIKGWQFHFESPSAILMTLATDRLYQFKVFWLQRDKRLVKIKFTKSTQRRHSAIKPQFFILVCRLCSSGTDIFGWQIGFGLRSHKQWTEDSF